MTAKHMVLQNIRKSCRLVKSMNVFECLVNLNVLCPFSFVKAKTKERKKAFSCESAADPAPSAKGYFYNLDKWQREIEEHERKSVTSEKQSVEMSSLKLF